MTNSRDRQYRREEAGERRVDGLKRAAQRRVDRLDILNGRNEHKREQDTPDHTLLNLFNMRPDDHRSVIV
jgi:hypothetical protein